MTLAFTTPRRFSPTLSLHVALLCICSSRHCFNQLLLCHPSQPTLLSLQTRTTMSGEKHSRLLMGSPIGIDCREMVHPQRRTVPDGPRLWHHIAAATRFEDRRTLADFSVRIRLTARLIAFWDAFQAFQNALRASLTIADNPST